MAKLDFPNTPVPGDQFVAQNSVRYTYDGEVWMVTGRAGGTGAYLLAGAVIGNSQDATVVASYEAAYAFTFPIGLPGSLGSLKTAPASLTLFDIQVNAVTKGTMQWSAGLTAASFNWAAVVPIAIGDRIEVLSRAGVDSPTWTLKGLF